MADVTRLLLEMRCGSASAESDLAALVYEDLHRLAASYLRGERRGHTLEATALVHEAWLRLAGADQITLVDRAHFFAVAAAVMRRVLIDYARRRCAGRRGGGSAAVTLQEASSACCEPDWGAILDIHAALESLTEISPRAARVVEMRFFAGLEVEETASALGVAPATVKRDWVFAQAWLFDRLQRGPSETKAPG